MTARLSTKGKGESPKLLIRMPAEAISALKRLAKYAGKEYSEYVRTLLLEHIETKKRE
jgi:predicted DNA-binding protein